MNETQHRFKIGQAIQGLAVCDLPEYGLAVNLLMGQKPRRAPIYRSFSARVKDALSAAKKEFMRKDVVIPFSRT